MPIVVNLDVMMAKRHIGAGELAEQIGITPANLSILKNNKAKAVRFPRWKPSAAHWTVNPPTCWNTGPARRMDRTFTPDQIRRNR